LRARGPLLAALAPRMFVAFGASGVTLKDAELAFEIPATQLASISTSADGQLALKLIATAENGSTAERDLGSVELLDRYTGAQRYGGRDESRGGDDWVKPSARDVVNAVSGVTWGDFSNMNAGSFAPDHSSHTRGTDADGWFAGYNARDAATAASMIQLLNTDRVGKRVRIVYVTYVEKDGEAFYDGIKNVTLSDGRPARAVIRNFTGHTSHFHWSMP